MGPCSMILTFVFLNFSFIHLGNPCPVSSCGLKLLDIRYPFKLRSQTLPNNCSYFNLTCSTTESTLIQNLPHSGDFYVQNIDYVRRYIQLYDPENCLMRRLMNFSLSPSSHFKAMSYKNYTFYVCPKDSHLLDSSRVEQIGCLSNSTSTMMVTRELSREYMEGYGCRGIGNWSIPVSRAVQFGEGDGFKDDVFLFLTWDLTVCKDCEESENLYSRKVESENQESPGNKSRTKPIAKIVAIVMSMPALIMVSLSCCSVFCLHLMRMIGYKHEVDVIVAQTAIATPQISTLPPPSTTTNHGLDESKIMECTEIIVVSEIDESIPNGDNISACSICLEDYCGKKRTRLISKCGHCFHDVCIQQWLGQNSTCPVCRISVSYVPL